MRQLKTYASPQNGIIILAFLVSRILVSFRHIDLDYSALYRYWQYLDVLTLRQELLRGVWFDHTQPPFFNLLLGWTLQTTGIHSRIAFVLLLKLLTLFNTFLLYTILRHILPKSHWPLIIALLYLLSPATILFENELFYTSLLSALFLLASLALLNFRTGITAWKAAGFILPLALICLTRSMYHLLWLSIVTAATAYGYRKTKGSRCLVPFSLLAILLVGGWYLKNLVIFHSFSASTWIGMNFSRNVFHDTPPGDSSKIESIEPFSRISAYTSFLPHNYSAPYAGLEDRVLLDEFKNDSFVNEKNVGYITVSNLYMAACLKQIRSRPLAYVQNVAQSAITFFAPATRYPTTEYQANKLGWYDLLYSFNLSHLARGKQQRRIALTLSAIPKFLAYLFVLCSVTLTWYRTKKIDPLDLFIVFTITYIFCISSLFEHYENMRFRYEAEPLFLILLAKTLIKLHFSKLKYSFKKNQAAELL